MLLIVDRNELQSQLFRTCDNQEDCTWLPNVTCDHNKFDTRGLILSMIHKFGDYTEPTPTSSCWWMEAHRTTGDLGNYLMGALPNTTFIGFTGTPIDARMARHLPSAP